MRLHYMMLLDELIQMMIGMTSKNCRTIKTPRFIRPCVRQRALESLLFNYRTKLQSAREY